jgi:outer membrane murein-binding lipoprotein Lpp
MKMIAVVLISFVLGGCAHASKHPHYIRDIEAIAKTDQKRIHRYQQNPPASVTQGEAAAYESLVELDLYLLYREVCMYKHSFSTKTQVEAKLAQLSRDMEDAPETHHETAQSGPVNPQK